MQCLRQCSLQPTTVRLSVASSPVAVGLPAPRAARLADQVSCVWQGAEGQQLQALMALQGLARGSKQWSTVSFAAVQSAFREAGGFPLLVNLIATARSPRSALLLLA